MREPRDDGSRTGVRGGLSIAALLLAALLFAALPLGAGVVVACVVPGLGGIRPGLGLPGLTAILLAITIVAVVIGERPMRTMRLLMPGRPRLQRPAAELVTFFLLVTLLLVPLATPLGALTAGATAAAGYRCLEQTITRTNRRKKDHDP